MCATVTDMRNRDRSDWKPRRRFRQVAIPSKTAGSSHHADALVSYHVPICFQVNRCVHIQKASCGWFVHSQPASCKEVQGNLCFTSSAQ